MAGLSATLPSYTDGLQQFPVRHRFPGVGYQVPEQLEFLGRQADNRAVGPDMTRFKIDFQFRRCESARTVFGRGRRTPERRSMRASSSSMLIGDKDPIAIQREAPRTLAGLIEVAPDELLSRRSAPGKWSVRAILAHLAEDELVSSWRYRQMIEHSGATLLGFDQDEWAQLGDYDSWKARDALEMFRLLREANLRLFARLTPGEWQCWGRHAERGRITVEDLARHMAAHDVNHIKQVRRLCVARPQAACGFSASSVPTSVEPRTGR